MLRGLRSSRRLCLRCSTTIRRGKQAHGEDDPIFSQGLERDGWTLKSSWHVENRGYPKLFHTIQPEVREKANPGGSYVIRLTRSIECLDYSEEFALRGSLVSYTCFDILTDNSAESVTVQKRGSSPRSGLRVCRGIQAAATTCRPWTRVAISNFNEVDMSRSHFEDYAQPAILLAKDNHEKQNSVGGLSFVVLVSLYPPARRLWKSAYESAYNRFPKRETRKEQCRLRLCLPENEVLFLPDRREDGRALRLRAQRRATLESSAAG